MQLEDTTDLKERFGPKWAYLLTDTINQIDEILEEGRIVPHPIHTEKTIFDLNGEEIEEIKAYNTITGELEDTTHYKTSRKFVDSVFIQGQKIDYYQNKRQSIQLRKPSDDITVGYWEEVQIPQPDGSHVLGQEYITEMVPDEEPPF